MDKILELLMSKPEILVPVIKEYINKYKPMVYDLAQEAVEIYKDYSNNTEYPTVVAKTKKICMMLMFLLGSQKIRR